MSEKAAKKAPAKRGGAKRAPTKRKAPKAERKEAVEEGPKMASERTPAPVPVVLTRHESAMQQRDARGYSLGELESAGIAFIVAKRIRVPLDIRRRSVLEGNVAKLKGWYQPVPKKARTEAAESKVGEAGEEGGKEGQEDGEAQRVK